MNLKLGIWFGLLDHLGTHSPVLEVDLSLLRLCVVLRNGEAGTGAHIEQRTVVQAYPRPSAIASVNNVTPVNERLHRTWQLLRAARDSHIRYGARNLAGALSGLGQNIRGHDNGKECKDNWSGEQRGTSLRTGSPKTSIEPLFGTS
jgi:hypothetical protein